MGEVTAVGDDVALAEAIIRVLSQREAYRADVQTIAASFDPAQTAAEYVRLFTHLQAGRAMGQTTEPEAYERLRERQGSRGAEEQG
jgi:hypothetical protein